MLQLHFYGYWHQDWTTQKQWTDDCKTGWARTRRARSSGEWGAGNVTGLDYNTNTPDGDNAISYITATADFMHDNMMGSVYWPGLRDGDSYSMMKRDTSASPITLSVVNASGRDRLRWAWNLYRRRAVSLSSVAPYLGLGMLAGGGCHFCCVCWMML